MSALRNEAAVTREEQAALWCISLSEGLAPDERDEFDIWIEIPDNAAALDDALRVWQAADQAGDMPEVVRVRTAALENYRRANSKRWTKRIGSHRYWFGGIAAMFVIMLITTSPLRDPVAVYRTGIGERQVAMLEDGSKISLDADTEVDVRLSKDRRELVLVQGRAKFDVARDPFRPFSVKAGDKIVVATGTSFSVELVRRQVRVLLYEGHVAVVESKDDRAIQQRVRGSSTTIAADQMLTPGKELVAAIDVPLAASIRTVDSAKSLSWESGQLSFDDEPLAMAAERMNRYSTTKLIVADSASAAIRVNGVFDAGDTDAFLEGVAAFNRVRVSRDQDRLTIRSN